ncbi:Uncharacterised protein [Mycobacteroides abscessus subsp. abscessus]|nr:Uncharacterised protein [Mycobacteroides abscessus subsp. abscessus]
MALRPASAMGLGATTACGMAWSTPRPLGSATTGLRLLGTPGATRLG